MAMAEQWLTTEGIQVGDLFLRWSLSCGDSREYYQVTELRGKKTVVLRPIEDEFILNPGLAPDSPALSLFHAISPRRPLPGQFCPCHFCDARLDEVTARPVPHEGDRWLLKDWGLGGFHIFDSVRPEDWECWDEKFIRAHEEYYRALDRAKREYLEGKEEVEWPEWPEFPG